MNILRYSSVVLFAFASSGCVTEANNDTDATEVADVSEVADAPGTPGAPAAADVPVVLNESSAGLSIAASSGALTSAGVSYWEVASTQSGARVRAYGGDGNLLADLGFESASNEPGTVTEHLTGESMRLGTDGAATEGFSAKNRELFAALSRDASAGTPSAEDAITQKAGLVGGPCSVCKTPLLYCGELEWNDELNEGPILSWDNLYECSRQEICGVCWGWSFW